MPGPSPTDFVVEVEGLGSFTFAKRTVRLQQLLQVDYRRRTGGEELSPEELAVAEATATLKALTVQAPDGWDPDDADPFEPSTYPNIIRVWGALREQEATFRKPK